MSKLLACAMCLGVSALVACNDSSSGDDAPPIDAPPDVPDQGPCDPLAPPGMQGCETGQKCTWIFIQDDPESVGKIGCVPDGTVDLGAACERGAAGETTGYDDCKAGMICVGTCKDICGFGGGATEQCAAGQACANYADYWANGEDEPMYGACNPTCNPVTQLRGDGTPCGMGQGCYMQVTATTSKALCAGAGTIGHNQVIPGTVFVNSCLPGHQPRRANATDMTFECGALCDVKDVFITDPANADGGNRPMAKPAAQVTNFAAEGGMDPFTCTSKGAAPPADPSAGEGCRYWWAREPFDDLSPFSNTVGWCFKHSVFQYDSDGNMADDSPFPRCAALSSGDKVLPIANPPHDDARYFFCKSLPAMLQTSIRHVKKPVHGGEPRLDRFSAPAAR